ncbi:nucleotide sugar dehydrogenase, partial [Actinomadura sp. HBU206391]|nr:nucleotide sugar dehydrogenase [Actinomadura sp. HBU206391]
MDLDVVVVGLGYVGLPLAREACRAGLRVGGLDRDEGVVTRLAAGTSHVDDVSDGDLTAMLSAGFIPTADPAVISSARCAVICVPTPLTTDQGPDLKAVIGATRAVAERLR